MQRAQLEAQAVRKKSESATKHALQLGHRDAVGAICWHLTTERSLATHRALKLAVSLLACLINLTEWIAITSLN
jgi:hypothetical protein